MYNGVQIIAEVKTKSPFGFESEKSWDELFSVANEIGDILSIHTDSRWGGDYDLVKRAKDLTNTPILAKGIHATDDEVRKAVDAGADYVLVAGRIPNTEDYIDRCLIEPYYLSELQQLDYRTKVVWNARDLETGTPKTETFEQARSWWNGWLCQASYVNTIDNIKAGANAVLVGTSLEEFAQSMKK